MTIVKKAVRCQHDGDLVSVISMIGKTLENHKWTGHLSVCSFLMYDLIHRPNYATALYGAFGCLVGHRRSSKSGYCRLKSGDNEIME